MSSLESLRQQIAVHSPYRQRESLSFSELPKGIPLGAITEVSGFGKTEFVAALLREHSEHRVAWLERQISIYPNALAQRQVQLRQLLFIETQKESPWVLRQVLRSGLFKIVVTENVFQKEKQIRQLQLLTEKSKTALLLLSEQLSEFWSVAIKLRVHNQNILSIRDRRGGL